MYRGGMEPFVTSCYAIRIQTQARATARANGKTGADAERIAPTISRGIL